MSPRVISRTVRGAIASAAATVMVLAGVSVPASAAGVAMTLSNSAGPSGGGGMIIGKVPVASATFPAVPVVQFQYVSSTVTACTAQAQAIAQIAGTSSVTAGVLTVDPALVQRISSSKIAFRVPSASYPGDTNNPNGLVLMGSQTQARWDICVYDTNSTISSTLLATASYTLVLKPTITSISPATSPASGGQTVTVIGQGYTSVTNAITGAVDGVALTNIKVAANGSSFTAVTSAHAAAAGLALTVVTPGGTVSSLDPDDDSNATGTPLPFEYTNGISVSPNTAVSGTEATIDVTGAGFSALHFDVGGTPTSGSAHVFLVKDAYDPTTNRGVSECAVEAVLSDTELVCTLDLLTQLSPTTSAFVSGPVPNGAYIMTVVQDGGIGAGDANPSIISSGAAFIVGPY